MSPILACGDPVTVVDMSLRRVVEDLLGADGSGTDGLAPGDDRAAAALEAAGHGELEPELYGEALVHFADTAPLEQADVLSPIVTEASAVPIDPDLDPPTPVDATDDGVEPAVDGAGDPDPGDDDPDVLDSDSIDTGETALEEGTALDRGSESDGFGSGAGLDTVAGTPSDRADTIDEGGTDRTSLDARPGEPDVALVADPPDPLDPLDPFDPTAAEGSDGAGLAEGLELVDEPDDIDPDLLLDE